MPRLVVRPLQQFFRLEASGGLVLLGATVAALIWANVASVGYEDFWTTPVTLEIGDWQLDETVRDLVNDGLMAIFFLVIGLEVKRELARRRALERPRRPAAGGGRARRAWWSRPSSSSR